MNGQNQGKDVKEAAEQAEGAIAETAQMLKGVAADVGGRVQDLARETGRQAGVAASAAAQTVYGTSGEVLDVVEGAIRENLWGALLIAGAAGYGLACLIKSR